MKKIIGVLLVLPLAILTTLIIIGAIMGLIEAGILLEVTALLAIPLMAIIGKDILSE